MSGFVKVRVAMMSSMAAWTPQRRRYGDRLEGCAPLAERRRDGDVLAAVDVPAAEVAVAPGCRPDDPRSGKLQPLRYRHAISVDLEEDRPEVRLGTPPAVPFVVAVNAVEVEPDLKQVARHDRFLPP
jgi:hypothetical protein